VNHNNVISLPINSASQAGDLLVLQGDATCAPYGSTNVKEQVIGVALHDVDPSEIGDPHAVHLFSGIFIAKAQGPISVGDIVGIVDGNSNVVNSGTLRQIGIANESIASGVNLISIIST
tara:strand:+ start:1380 stop:1736 length:357 start_codon:yes stop_codon:yes gene_type:complete